ncbi:MAG: transcriptional activator NhaR [Magnetococcales bacterium]|nr:transcriptional activator NhaR [Magnetococcales bacterium]
MNYKHLHYFWTVARVGSITAAGRLLRLRPQTLSTQLQVLEEAFGLSLFERVGRRLELTETGQVVFDYANEMFLLGNELDEMLKGMPTQRPLRFRVGIADVIPKLIAYRFLEPALRCEREVHLVCNEDKMVNLLADLALHKLDMVLADSPTIPGISVRTYHYSMGSVGVTFFGTPGLRAKHPGPFPALLSNAPMLMPTVGNSIRGDIGRWLNDLGIIPRIVAEFEDTALLKAFGQAGAGFFFIPSIIEDDVVYQHQVEVVGHTQAVQAEYFAITTQRRVNHPAIQAIKESRQRIKV